ncbi:flagellar motor switch protein FliN [Aestuariispira ectoiniformans]|uniref:flagellar motor switch protein FliN n=1 Tax=Aestuariispira ectoiniformans TaxID=2775080 RepID=UPI00223BD64D|nr:flagellar motor switch protein FliN [Aestuariispira ectoiniformans]
MAQDDENGEVTEGEDAQDENFSLEELETGDIGGEPLDPRAAELVVPTGARDLEAVYEIPVQVAAVLGKSHMQVSQLLKLGRGAVVELDRKVGEAIDIYVNNRLVARGEVVVVDDKLGVTMTEIIKSDKSTT